MHEIRSHRDTRRPRLFPSLVAGAVMAILAVVPLYMQGGAAPVTPTARPSVTPGCEGCDDPVVVTEFVTVTEPAVTVTQWRTKTVTQTVTKLVTQVVTVTVTAEPTPTPTPTPEPSATPEPTATP